MIETVQVARLQSPAVELAAAIGRRLWLPLAAAPDPAYHRMLPTLPHSGRRPVVGGSGDQSAPGRRDGLPTPAAGGSQPQFAGAQGPQLDRAESPGQSSGRGSAVGFGRCCWLAPPPDRLTRAPADRRPGSMSSILRNRIRGEGRRGTAIQLSRHPCRPGENLSRPLRDR